MDGVNVALERTLVTRDEFAKACIIACPNVLGSQANDEVTSVLWAQYMIETGGRNCWNWNIGNVKKRDGDGFDYHYLHNVWEGVSPATANRLIAEGAATADPSKDHAKAVGPNRQSILYNPPRPETMFRAYAKLSVSMAHHIAFIALGRYSACWPKAVAGDVVGYAVALHNAGYYTASSDAYAAGMMKPFGDYLNSNAWESAREAIELPKAEKPIDFQAYDRGSRFLFDRPIVDDEDPSEPDPAA